MIHSVIRDVMAPNVSKSHTWSCPLSWDVVTQRLCACVSPCVWTLAWVLESSVPAPPPEDYCCWKNFFVPTVLECLSSSTSLGNSEPKVNGTTEQWNTAGISHSKSPAHTALPTVVGTWHLLSLLHSTQFIFSALLSRFWRPQVTEDHEFWQRVGKVFLESEDSNSNATD